MEGLEMVRIIAETHLATVALCHCVTSGLQVAVKMYHRDRLTGKMHKQVPASKASSCPSYGLRSSIHSGTCSK